MSTRDRRSWYQANRDREIARASKWAREHKVERAARVRDFRKAHPDLVRERERAYNLKYRRRHRARFNAAARERYKRTRERRHPGLAVVGVKLCGLCGRVPGKKGLAVDHCHETGRIRGLLCSNCNLGLGNFHDDPAVLQAAIDYLKPRLEVLA